MKNDITNVLTSDGPSMQINCKMPPPVTDTLTLNFNKIAVRGGNTGQVFDIMRIFKALENHNPIIKQDLDFAIKTLKQIVAIRENLEDYYGGTSINYCKMVDDIIRTAKGALTLLNLGERNG